MPIIMFLTSEPPETEAPNPCILYFSPCTLKHEILYQQFTSTFLIDF